MDIDTLHGLMQCQLFKDLAESEVIELMHTIRYRIVRFRKGDIFSYAGTACLHADIIISGEMTASLMGPSGKIVRITMHHSGNMLAPAFLFAADNAYPVTVEATKDTQIFRLQPGDMELLIQNDHRIAMNFIRILSNIIAYLTKKVGILSMNIREKILLYLKEERQRQQTDHLTIPMSRQELADHFGIQKYSLQRCLNELQSSGIIRLDGKHIDLL